MKRLLVVLMVIAALLCACTSYVRLMDGWVGASEEELVAKWGEPDSVRTLKDGKILTYEKFWKDTDEVINRGRLKFAIDAEGTVISWKKTNFPDYLYKGHPEIFPR